MNERYTYTGSIRAVTQSSLDRKIEILCYDPADESVAPTRLEALGNVAEYIKALIMSDSRERYARKAVHFDRWCTVTQVDVLGENGEVVKTVDRGSGAWTPFIGEATREEVRHGWQD